MAVCREDKVQLLVQECNYFIKKYYSFNYPWMLIAKAVVSALMFIPWIFIVRELSLPLVYMVIVSVSGCIFTYLAMQLFVFKSNLLSDIVSIIKLKLNTSKL